MRGVRSTIARTPHLWASRCSSHGCPPALDNWNGRQCPRAAVRFTPAVPEHEVQRMIEQGHLTRPYIDGRAYLKLTPMLVRALREPAAV